MEVLGYRLPTDRGYDPATHMWVQPTAATRARIGFDPLGRETSGDVVAISFAEVGTWVRRGAEFGSLEAAKFVGPLIAPVTGTIAAHNPAVSADPGLLNDDPIAHWLVEIDVEEVVELLSGESEISDWFASEVKHFRAAGAIAE